MSQGRRSCTNGCWWLVVMDAAWRRYWSLWVGGRRHRSLWVGGRRHRSLWVGGRRHRSLWVGGRRHRSLWVGGRRHRSLWVGGRRHRSLWVGGRRHRSLWVGGRRHRSLSVGGRRHRSLSVGGRRHRSLWVGGRRHRSLLQWHLAAGARVWGCWLLRQWLIARAAANAAASYKESCDLDDQGGVCWESAMKFIARERARLTNFVWCFTDPKNTDWLLESACVNLLADNNLRLFLLHNPQPKHQIWTPSAKPFPRCRSAVCTCARAEIYHPWLVEST